MLICPIFYVETMQPATAFPCYCIGDVPSAAALSSSCLWVYASTAARCFAIAMEEIIDFDGFLLNFDFDFDFGLIIDFDYCPFSLVT